MMEQDKPASDANQPQNPDKPNEATPPKRKRRRWPWVILSLVVLLLLVVVLAPTIISTSLGRNAAVGIINDNINGRAEIGGLSLGWFSPTEVTGIKVFGEDNRLILDVPRAKINLTVLNALRQKFALGNDSQIDIASFIVNVDADGKT